ncbi:MAG: glycosyltransferase family 2 protein [Theionarchaea archaeon]|nr:glycosyltransferase family 2 protein [Theionarchaea archaeon]
MTVPDLIGLLFVVIVGYDLSYFIIFFYQSLRTPVAEYSPPISVIIPVYNNESTIGQCVQSVLDSDYPLEEVIVVNDGSTDHTRDILQGLQGITMYSIPHAGKAAALNYGIARSTGDIVTLDADTAVRKDTIRMLVRNLQVYDAVAGNLQVSNVKKFLGRCQAIEHVRVAMFRKVAQYFNDIDIVPGPLGAFRREIFSKLRYGTSLVEDMELTHCLLKEGFTIGYEQEAKAYTQMPDEWVLFVKQRLRWAKGNLHLLFDGNAPIRKFLTGYGLALADMLLVILCFFYGQYLVLILFLGFESATMVVGTYRERAHLYMESLLFPVFMLFLDSMFLISHIFGLLSIGFSLDRS